MSTNPQTLVLVDWESRRNCPVRDVQSVIDRVGDAMLRYDRRTIDPKGRVEHRIVFDANQLRNTHAHGFGCQFGFVTHIDYEETR